MASSHRLKVGVDFGTTFSGVSWVHTAKNDEVNVIMKWPGTSRACVKVPSEISYTTTGEVHKWGYELKIGDERNAWFKLLLQPAQYTSADSSMVERTKDLATTKKPVDIVADYLSCLRKHFQQTIMGSLGKSFWEATPIDYTLTVPAIWGDAAKALTLQAAEKAGFGNTDTIHLMSEPDAAAAWTLLRDIDTNNLKVKDAFIVVDCGGGTVDLISYEVQNLKPFTVRECAKGTGGRCGSVFLDEGFQELVRSRIGTRFDKMKVATKNRMLKEWEEVLKPEFSNSEEDDIFSCPIGGIPDDPEMGIEDGAFIVTREEMLAIFDPIIDQIILLVQEQIDMVESQNQEKLHISSILLVGGFGASKYLLQRLKNELEEGRGARRSSIEILQPLNAWSAVSRGAAVGIRISSRKARRHYGVVYNTSFIHGYHPLKNLYYDNYTDRAMCSNCIKWYIKKGDEVSEDEPISFSFGINVPVDHDLEFQNGLFHCEQDEAPQYSNMDSGFTLKKTCVINIDLSEVPKNLFSRRTGHDGTPYYSIECELVTIIRSGDIHFEMEFNGKRYGKARAKYVHY